jgi:IMP dehydrogenase
MNDFDDSAMVYKLAAAKSSDMIQGLTYDDVLLIPQYSEVESRSHVDTSVTLSKGLKSRLPIVPANMKTVTGFQMAIEIFNLGGIAILHRFMPFKEQLEFAQKYTRSNLMNHLGFSVGVKSEDYENLPKLVEAGVKIICIDIAHGDSKMCVDMTKHISTTYPNVFLISGNVATYGGTARLLEAGADMVKVGIGPGSLCTTRVETGNGVPQLSAIMFADYARAEFEYRTKKKVFIMADGGIKNAGDCVKALCYADMVMAGNLFAGSEETPGRVISVDGKLYKDYVGSSTHKGSHVEGVAALVPLKGHTKDIVQKLNEGIKSGCSYQGSSNLTELKQKFQMMRMTGASLHESHPHNAHVR